MLWRLRALIAVIVLAAGAWSGAWLWTAAGWERDLTGWMEARRAEGWQAEWRSVEVRGFPNRLDTTITDIALADTRAGWAWTAPFVQIFSLIYTRHDLIVALPQDSVLQTPAARYRLHGDDIRASVALDPERALALERVTAVLDGVALARDEGGAWNAGQVRLAAERKTPEGTEYRLGLALRDVAAPRGLGPQGATAQVQADLSVTFDRAWDRGALEDARPQPTRIRIDRADILWADLELRVAGSVEISTSGTPEGQLTVKLENWRAVLALAVESGALPAELQGTVARALELASGLSGRPDSLDLPLDLRRGRIFLGPVPVADAPRLRLR